MEVFKSLIIGILATVITTERFHTFPYCVIICKVMQNITINRRRRYIHKMSINTGHISHILINASWILHLSKIFRSKLGFLRVLFS